MSQSVIAVGDLDDDTYTDLIAIRGDRNFVIYIWDNKQHRFMDPGEVFDAGCNIDSINIVRLSNLGPGVFLKCDEGKAAGVVKVYQYI